MSLAATWLFLSFATVHVRLDAMLRLSTRTLFIGGQLVVSLAIMVLSVGRLAEFHYIATIVESTSVWLVLSTFGTLQIEHRRY